MNNLDRLRTAFLREITGDEEIRFKPNHPFGGLPKLPPNKRSKTTVYSDKCYICRDPSYAQHGLPLCRACPYCGGHIAADDDMCDVCNRSDMGYYSREDNDNE